MVNTKTVGFQLILILKNLQIKLWAHFGYKSNTFIAQKAIKQTAVKFMEVNMPNIKISFIIFYC